MSTSVAKNTAFMTTASIGQKVVSFLYFTLLANMLDVGDIGRYFVALSFTTIFSIFIDVGLSPVLTREVAKSKDKAQAYLQSVLTTKLVTSSLAYLLMVGAIYLLGYPGDIRILILVAGLVMILDSIHLTYYAVLRSLQDVRWEAIGMFGSQILTMILGLYAVNFGLPIVYLIWAFVFSSSVNVIYIAIVTAQKYQIGYRPRYDKVLIKKALVMAFPFALAGVFARVYSSLDTVLLERLVSDHEAGIYSVPYKIVFAFQFIPMALIASVYPKMSEYYACNKQKLSDLFAQSMRYLLVIALPIAVGVALVSGDVIQLLYGEEYEASVVPLQLLIVSVVFSFVSFPVGSVLNACNRQHIQTAIMGIVMVINAVLNLLFIPKYGAVAAASSATISYAVLFIAGLIMTRAVINVSFKALYLYAIRIGLACAIMAVLVYTSALYVPLGIQIFIGAVSYIAAILLLRVVTRDDVTAILHRKIT